MRRVVMLSFAPVVMACVVVLGCKSNNEDTTTTWNEGNPWGEHRASQTGETMAPGTANSMPPATQPVKSMGNT